MKQLINDNPKKAIQFSIPIRLKKQLIELSDSDGLSIAEIIAGAIDWYMDIGGRICHLKDCSSRDMNILKHSTVYANINELHLELAVLKSLERRDNKRYDKVEFIRRILWLYVGEFYEVGI